jgi:hypothetical protein
MEEGTQAPMWTPMNVGLFAATLLVFALSTSEFLVPLGVLGLSGYVAGRVLMESIPGRLLRVSVFGLAPSSLLLFVVFLLQLRCPFRKPVLVARHVLNVAFSGFGILGMLADWGDFNGIFKAVKILISIFWAAIIFYSLPAIGIVLFVPHRK